MALALAAGSAAVAYFTGGGTGTGTATVGSSTAGVTISGTTSGELYPGGSAGTVKIRVKNTSSTQSAHVGTVSLSKITPDAAHESCATGLTGSPPPFEMASVAINQTLGAGAEVEATGSLKMNDTGVSQDACQGAKLTLSFTSS
ncbi:MAG TPA: hypothetical protein VFW38_01400 [Solirubrobacteraceae bacterium]|nr:hypothetical protein [Solirubrobacteraceae bacterium]